MAMVVRPAPLLWSDLIAGLIRLMNYRPNQPGNPDEFTIREPELVRIQINPKLQLVEKPCCRMTPSSGNRRRPRSSAVELAADVSLEQGLVPTIVSFRNFLNLPKAAGRDHSTDLLHRCGPRGRPDHGGDQVAA